MRRCHACLLALLLSASSALALAWTPPADPDPEQILNEARADAKAGRLADAAAKHAWYHDNVLGLLPSHGGVRLSFALGAWHDLAKIYPPAMSDLRAARDRAMVRVRSGGSRASLAFSDLSHLNRLLGDAAMTRDAYALVAAQSTKEARLHLGEALPALVETRAYTLASAHLETEELMQRMTELHRLISDNRRVPAEHREAVERYQQQRTDRDWARVVVTLVQANRRADADVFARRARELLGGGVATPLIDAALRGEPPPPDRG